MPLRDEEGRDAHHRWAEQAIGVASLAFPAIVVLAQPGFVVPRSVFVLQPILLLLLMSGSRMLYRAWKERNIGRLGALYGKPVLVLGAGDTAVTLLKDYPDATDEDINAVMAGNLCRCMTYVRIRKAIKLAAARMRLAATR